jgi:hypothetical protein
VGTAPAPYLADLTTGGRLALAVRLWPEYLRLFFWPASLSPEWGPDAIIPVGWGSPRVWLGLACGAAAAAAAWVSWRRERWVVSGVLWCGLTLLPVSQIPFAVGVMIAERTMYLPSVGLAFLFPPLVRALRRERAPTRRAVAAMLAVAVALGAWKTWSRNPIWNTSFTVFDSMVDEHPHLWWVEWKAGQILARSGHGEEALPWYRKALVKTRFKHYNMLMDYASSLIAIGHRDEAARILDRAIRIGPDAVPARVLLSSLLIDEGRFPEAVAAGRAALRVPKYGEMSKEEINDRLAVAYDAMGRTDSALVLRRSTLGHFVIRHAFETWFHYARLLKLSGDDRGAAAALDSARARVAPHLRGRLTLDPLPSATALEVKGWTGMIVQQPAALGAATFQGAAPGGDSAAPRRRR